MGQVNGTSSSSGNNDKGSFSRFVTVRTPAAHEGVGRALNIAYRPQANDLPPDMIDLLDKLDEQRGLRGAGRS